MNEIKARFDVQEGVLYPIPFKDRDIWGKMKPFIMAICVILLVLSVFFRENMVKQLGLVYQVALVFLFLRVFFVQNHRFGPSDMSIFFYEDRVEIFRNQVYRAKKEIYQEWECMYYRDMKECKYRVETTQLEIFGRVSTRRKRYDVYGRLSDSYCFDKVTDSMINFYTQFLDVNSVIEAINQYTPLQVEERMS